MKRRPYQSVVRFALLLSCLPAVLGLRTTASAATVSWAPYPDALPFGDTIQGSRVEFDVVLRSGIQPAPIPSFVAHLPRFIRGTVDAYYRRTQVSRTIAKWRMQVEPPPFVVVDEQRFEFFSPLGLMARIRAHLDTDHIRRCSGLLRVKLQGPIKTPNVISIPISAKILPPPASGAKVLVCSTPYQGFSTDRGTHFLPLAALKGRLAARGIRLDFTYSLPESLAAYDGFLIGDARLIYLSVPQMQRLRQRVGQGAFLVLGADSYIHGTARKAAEVAELYGLHVDTARVGQGVTNSIVVEDRLTDGVASFGFRGPVRISVIDPGQGKVLLRGPEGPGGYAAVSRAPGRGEVRVLSEALWWFTLNAEGGWPENARFIERLLSP